MTHAQAALYTLLNAWRRCPACDGRAWCRSDRFSEARQSKLHLNHWQCAGCGKWAWLFRERPALYVGDVGGRPAFQLGPHPGLAQ